MKKNDNHMARVEAISSLLARNAAQAAMQRADLGRELNQGGCDTAKSTADPIDAILTGIRFHSKTDREKLRARIQEYATTRVNQMHGHLTMKYGEETKALYVTIEKLKRELRRAHERHVADLVERNIFPDYGTAGAIEKEARRA